MSYTIKHTDFYNKGSITINDSTLNTETSLAIPGRNYRGYGIAVGESFLHLLENFANSTAPINPTEGQLWYDTTTGVEDLKVYDGTTWKSSGSIRKSSSTPEIGVLGDLWVDTDNQQLFLFNGASWVLVGPTFSSGLRTGIVAETLLDSNDIQRVVLKTYIEDEVVSIFSLDSFIPKVAIEGFTVINSGTNISTKDFNSDGIVDTKYWGTAEKAENLVVNGTTVTSTNFLRKDTSNITNFGFTVRNDQGIATGAEGQLRVSVDAGQIGSIYHSTPDSAFDLRINYAGETTTVIRTDSSGKVGIGINNLAPEETLDVLGTSRFTDIVKIQSIANVGEPLGAALQVSGGISIQKDITVSGNSDFTGTLVVGDPQGVGIDGKHIAISARSNGMFNIGSSNNRFANIYATAFYGNVVGNITGNVTGNVVGTASNLLSSTVFSITGDVTSSGFSFDGATGGTTKVFNTLINPDFVDNKTELTTVDGSDLLLIYRPGTGLGKMYRTTFFQKVATVPIGTILPYAGITPPNGYLFCDGSEKSRSSYPELFEIIGYSFGSSLTGIATFRLPDLRGKFALGRSGMDNADSIQTNDGLVDSNTQLMSGSTDATASVLGNSAGAEEKKLITANLPTHKHYLQDTSDESFYAVNSLSATPSDPNVIVANVSPTTTGGQGLPNTGNMIGATKNALDQFDPIAVDIMNPYLTINYIIFTGKFV